MERSARMMTRVALAALLTVALLVPMSASGLAAAGTVDDNTPVGAVPLVSNPIPGSLDTAPSAPYEDDGDVDFYSVHLDAGQTFTARLWAPSTTVFTLALYEPAALTTTPTPVPVAESFDVYYPVFLSSDDGDQAAFGYVAPTSGTYYLAVSTYVGTGTYDLQWALGAKPTVSFGPSKYIIYGKSATLSGTALASSGTPLVGQRVELYAWSYVSADFTRMGSTDTTTGGTFKFTVKPTMHTYYKAVVLTKQAGQSLGQSVSRQIKVRPILSTPKTTTYVRKNRAFKIWGYMKPKHASGNHTVYVYAYRKNSAGKYVYKKKIRMTNYNSSKYPTMTKYYTRSAYLPYTGKWKLVAKSADDGKHAYNKSSPVYFRVH